MFRRLLFFIFFLIGLYGCFGYKTNFLNTTTVAQNQVVLSPEIKDAGVPKNKSQTLLTFAKPKNVIHVAVNGSNNGDGSLDKPVRTLEKAFKISKNDTLIKMDKGTFEVNRMITVPSFVSLEGAGEKTVIVPGNNYKGVLFEAKDFKKEKGDGYQYFRNFNVDGKR